MFDNKTGITYCSYQLELEEIINGICNISFDIGIQIDNVDIESNKEIEYVKDLFGDNLFNNLSFDKNDLLETNSNGEYNYSKEDLFSEISNYYNNNVFYKKQIIDFLKESDILLINKKDTFFYTVNEKSSKDRITKALKKGKILSDVIDNISNDKIKNSLIKIDLFEHSAFYSNTVKISKLEGQPILPIINFDFINEDIVNVELEDFDNYWINIDGYKNKYNVVFNENSDICLVTNKENGEVLGLLIENFLVVYSNVDLSEYIKKEYLFKYYWLLFKNTYSENFNKQLTHSDLVNDFKKKNKEKNLNRLLSNLKNNLYLDNKIVIEKDFEVFFNKVVLIKNLTHLDDYEFIIPQNTKEMTALGVYSTEKKGSSYNLLHWLDNQNETKLLHFRSTPPTKKNKLPISTLKPEICFYFLEKYFEDLLEDIFKINKFEYLSNIHLSKSFNKFKCEVDFFVKGGNKFFYIEAKTKLSKYYIEEFLKKASKIIDLLKPMLIKGIEIEFVLLGGYSDFNVKDFQYFIDANEVDEYNKKRDGLNSIPYNFTVPIPDKKGSSVICIAEPEYSKLTKLILEICPK